MTPKTQVERALLSKLHNCKLPAMTHDRVEIRSLVSRPVAIGLTDKDRLLLATLCWKYRKQIDFKVWEYEFVASLLKLMPGMEGRPSRGSGQGPELVVSGTKS